MRARGPSIALMLACLGCTAKSPDGARPTPLASPRTSSNATPTPVEAIEPTEVELVIGWPDAPPKPSVEAKRSNSAALELHRAGDFEAALAGFEAARASSPTYDWARYNAACALARLGRHAESATLLRELLLEDLAQFRRRVLDDEDLAGLRASPEGIALLELLSRIEARYADLLVRGIPAFTYESLEERDEEGDYQTPYTDLRIGVYDPESRRFIALVPKIDDAFSGLLDRTGKRALVVTGTLERKDMWIVQPHRAKVMLHSLEYLGDVLLPPREVTPRDEVIHGLEARFGEGNEVIVTLVGEQYDQVKTYLRVDAHDIEEIGFEHRDNPDHEPPTLPMPMPYLSIVELARAEYRLDTTAYVKKSRAITIEGSASKLQLSTGHHDHLRILPSPDPLRLVVSSTQEFFSWDGADVEEELAPHRRNLHVIDLVDFHTDTVTNLLSGHGFVQAVWTDDGTLLIETPLGVLHYPPGSTTPVDDIPPGIHFGTPPFPEEAGA